MTSQDKMFVCFGLIGLVAFALVVRDDTPAEAGPADKTTILTERITPGTIQRYSQENLRKHPREPLPINIADWLATIDYPRQAIHDGNEGVLGVRVSVGPFGEVFRCEVTQSSGFAMFDKRSCDAISVRARFHPALDADQQATTGTFSTSIRWEMLD